MSKVKEDTKTLDEILSEAGISTKKEDTKNLVLWNDDVNSFEWVEICLISLLGFNPEKAKNSAWTVHLQGKDIVKTGSNESLEPYKKLLEERGLSVTIE